jgi:hypothetical protein
MKNTPLAQFYNDDITDLFGSNRTWLGDGTRAQEHVLNMLIAYSEIPADIGFHCPERWPLDLFWSAAATGHDIGRAQGCTAAFNGIVRQLRRAGLHAEASD